MFCDILCKPPLVSAKNICNNNSMGNNRPTITDETIGQIRALIQHNPQWNRSRLSRALCEMWDWRGENLQIKDISCRGLLRSLEAAGAVRLPKAQSVSRKAGNPDRIVLMEHDTAPIAGALDALTPLRVETATSKADLAEFKSYISQYHYLGFYRSLGETMKYRVSSRDGRHLALLMFGASAWSCRDRDAYIGWNREQRAARLHMLTNNSRFLVMPWVAVPCLASHVLGLVSRRISGDWEAKYGHGLAALETFVEFGRFRGVCYQASNWIRVGRTSGRGRNDADNLRALPEKDIYLLPLNPRWRKKLLSH
jgi:hypothetical protein